ncbi:hypothetical protein O3P69_010260 [Scylla paramamosain]|uniref:Uncharacterized protein n=1 Tax=Scylla paramamosain TaxID=85552 RepID=A0AAW0TSG8_SCYPA
MKADMEGTEILAPLKDIYDKPPIPGYSRQDAAHLTAVPLDALSAANPAKGEAAWATALVLVLLERKFGEQREEWELLATKGRAFLVGCGEQPEEMLAKARLTLDSQSATPSAAGEADLQVIRKNEEGKAQRYRRQGPRKDSNQVSNKNEEEEEKEEEPELVPDSIQNTAEEAQFQAAEHAKKETTGDGIRGSRQDSAMPGFPCEGFHAPLFTTRSKSKKRKQQTMNDQETLSEKAKTQRKEEAKQPSKKSKSSTKLYDGKQVKQHNKKKRKAGDMEDYDSHKKRKVDGGEEDMEHGEQNKRKDRKDRKTKATEGEKKAKKRKTQDIEDHESQPKKSKTQGTEEDESQPKKRKTRDTEEDESQPKKSKTQDKKEHESQPKTSKTQDAEEDKSQAKDWGEIFWFNVLAKKQEFKTKVPDTVNLNTERFQDWWKKSAGILRGVDREVLGETCGKSRTTRQQWWWSEHVKNALKRTKEIKKEWEQSGTRQNKLEYRRAKKLAGKAVAVAKAEACRDLLEKAANTRRREENMQDTKE